MADIELVIKMPEEVYKSIINGKNYISYQEYVEEAIKNGTPLPKGHGRIIDESQITGTFTWDNGYIECYAPTIIKADKEDD